MDTHSCYCGFSLLSSWERPTVIAFSFSGALLPLSWLFLKGTMCLFAYLFSVCCMHVNIWTCMPLSICGKARIGSLSTLCLEDNASPSYTLVVRHKEISLELTGKCPPCWLAFIAVECVLNLRKGINGLAQCWTLYAIMPTFQERGVCWCNRDRKVNNHFLIGFEVCSTGGNS